MAEEAEIHVNDVETIPDWLNKLARESGPNEIFPPEYSFDDVLDLCIQLDKRVSWERTEEGTIGEVQESTALSGREALVVRLKLEGLTHEAITLYSKVLDQSKHTTALPEGALHSRSTVDEYSRRAKEKFEQSKQTVSLLDPLY